MATCFCGCGTDVAFGRRRAANALGARFDEYLAIFHGALEQRAVEPDREVALRELVAAGAPLRDGLRDVVHGTRDRKDFDKGASRDWLKRAAGQRGQLAQQAIDGAYAGWNAHEQVELVHAGRKAPAVVIAVSDTGMTVNNDPRVKVRLRVEPDGEPPFEVERKLLVSRLAIPRRGDRVTVHWDPDDPSRFTFRDDVDLD